MEQILGHLEPDLERKDLLRQRAEAALHGKPVDLDDLQSEDIQFVLHELQVHQVELTMQNDELRRVQLELETSRDQYSDLYHAAPAGYFTLSRNGRILEANQTLAAMLGIETEKLIGSLLSRFVDRDDQDQVYLHRQRTLADGQRQVCEFQMVRPAGEKFSVHIESVVAPGDRNQIRSILSDVTERKKAEARLRASEEGLRQAQAVSHVGNWRWDIQGNHLDWSEEMFHIFGLEKEGFSGSLPEVIARAIHPDDREAVEASNRMVVEENNPTPLAYRIIRPGGEVRWVWAEAGELTLDGERKPVSLSGFVQDITERKQAEQALRESEKKFRTVVEANIIGIVFADPVSGDVTEANDEFLRIIGRSREELENRRINWKAITPAEILEREEQMAATKPLGVAWKPYEKEYLRPDGTRVPVIIGGDYLADQSGLVVAFVLDNLERRRMELALRESQDRLRVALENAPITLYTADRELRFTWIYETRYGFAPPDLLGRRFDEIFPAGDVTEAIALMHAVIESGVGQRQEVHFKLGTEAMVQDLTAEPMRDKLGEVTGVMVAAFDVTQQKRIEKEAYDLAAQREVQHRLLDQREQERQQIARDLHDGPVQELTAATFALRNLLMGDNDPDSAGQMEAIQTTLQTQIHELREYAGQLRPPTLAKFGLEQAIRSHAETFQEKYPDLHIRLEMHQTGEILREPTGLALFRIYQQALINILKHARASEVLVRFVKDEQHAQLEIQDNGQGFEQPKDWLTLVREGHLGLLGMRERAEAVGGTLEVTTQPGKGTLIQVSLPLDRPAA
jgi:PAS domain S-box-containing protein